jgi:hypothetical protein
VPTTPKIIEAFDPRGTFRRNAPSILILVAILPLTYAVFTWGVLTGWHVFDSQQSFAIGVAVAVVTLIVGWRDAHDLYYPNEVTVREPLEYLAAIAFFYLFTPAIGVGIGFAIARILEVPPWPAVALLVMSFWGRLHFSPITIGPMIGRPLMSAWHAAWKSEQAMKKGEKPIRWGNVFLRPNSIYTHFCVVGVTGSGKTSVLRLLMQDVLPEVGATFEARDGVGRTISIPYDCRAVIYDAKDDLYPELMGMGLKKPPVLLNPFDARSVAWDVAADFTDLTDATEMATILIPPMESESQPFFTNAGRMLLLNLIDVFNTLAPRRWTLRDVVIAFQDPTELEQIYGLVPDIERKIRAFFVEQGRELLSTITTVKSRIDRYEPIAAAWANTKETISIDKWITEESILLLGSREKSKAVMDAVNQLLMRRIHQTVLDNSELGRPSPTRRTWIILDEFTSLGSLKDMHLLLTKGRTYKAAVVLGFQDIREVRVIYKELGDVMAAQCQNKIVLRLGDEVTGGWASTFFGEVRYPGNPERWRVVDASTLLHLPLAGRENGLTGFGRTADLKDPFVVRFAGDELYGRDDYGTGGLLKPPSSDPKDAKFLPRDSSHFKLKSWDESDRERLGLSALSQSGNIWDLPHVDDLGKKRGKG